MLFKHSIKNNKHFAHASCKFDLLGFTGGQQLLIKTTYDRVITTGNQCCPVESGTYTGATTPNSTFPSQCTTVPVERRHSNKGSYTLSVQGSQLSPISQNVNCQLRFYTGYGTQQVVLFSRHTKLLHSVLLQISIYLTQLLLKPIDMKLDSLTYRRSGCAQPIFSVTSMPIT